MRLPEAERLAFRCWTEDDLPLARELWGDPRVTALIDARGALSDAQIRSKLASELECVQQHGVQYWPILRKVDGRFAGCAGLRPCHRRASIYELGFHIVHALWGQGLAQEAA